MAGIFGTPTKPLRLNSSARSAERSPGSYWASRALYHGHRLWMRTANMDEMNRHIINDDALMWQCSKTLLQRTEVKLSGPILRQALGII